MMSAVHRVEVVRQGVSRGGLCALGVLLAIAASACFPTVRESVRDSMDETSKEDNWQKLRAPAEGLAKAVTSGVIDGMSEVARQEQLAKSLDAYVAAFGAAAARELDTHLGPAAERQVRAAVAGVLDELLAAPVIEREVDAVDRITRAAVAAIGGESARSVRELGAALASTLESRLGPALATTLRDQLGPAMAATLDQQVKAFGAAFEREIAPRMIDVAARSSDAGTRAMIRTLDEEAGPRLDRLSSRLDHAFDRGERSLTTLGLCVLVTVLALATGGLGLLTWLRARTARRSQAALGLVVSKISEMRDHDSVQQLVARIRGAGKSDTAGEELSAFLRRRPDWKVSLARPASQ